MNLDKGPARKLIQHTVENHKQLGVECAFETIPSEKHPEYNEDAILTDERKKVFGVFDGVGGLSAGELASKTACYYFMDYLNDFLSNDVDIEKIKRKILEIFNGADKAVKDKADEKGVGEIATTATVLKIFNDYALIASVGDSRAYKINSKGEVQQITLDDDDLSVYFVGAERKEMAEHIANARRIEDLTDDELTFFRVRNIITKAIGFKNSKPNIYVVPIEKGDCFLLTSDGIHDNLTTDEIEEITKQSKVPAEIAKKLKEKAVARSKEPKSVEMRAKKDDMSVVVVGIK